MTGKKTRISEKVRAVCSLQPWGDDDGTTGFDGNKVDANTAINGEDKVTTEMFGP